MTWKSLLSYPWRRLQMARVGRGFTVHSPFAYHFIHFVLRERLPFYSFRSEVTSRAGKRLFRVANYFKPQTVACVGVDPEAMRIIRLACPRAQHVADPAGADFTYVAPGAPLPGAFRTLYAAYHRSAPLPPDAMTFTNGRTLIAVRRPALPPQSFRLRF